MSNYDAMVTMFLGKPASYWIEMQRLVDRELSPHESTTLELLLKENMTMRGKLSYVRGRVADMEAALRVWESPAI